MRLLIVIGIEPIVEIVDRASRHCHRFGWNRRRFRRNRRRFGRRRRLYGRIRVGRAWCINENTTPLVTGFLPGFFLVHGVYCGSD